MLAAGGELNMEKLKVRIPVARTDAEREENAVLKRGFLERGVVLPVNILEEGNHRVEQQGFTLLGVPHGTDEYKAQFILSNERHEVTI